DLGGPVHHRTENGRDLHGSLECGGYELGACPLGSEKGHRLPRLIQPVRSLYRAEQIRCGKNETAVPEPSVPQQFKKTALLRTKEIEGSPAGGLRSPLLRLCKYRQNITYTRDRQYHALYCS